VWSQPSSSLTLVVFEEAAKAFPTPHWACTLWGVADRRKKQHVVLALMIPLAMIMGFDEHLAENIRLGSEERFNERAFCFENNYLES
jgi:hypothetical protein